MPTALALRLPLAFRLTALVIWAVGTPGAAHRAAAAELKEPGDGLQGKAVSALAAGGNAVMARAGAELFKIGFERWISGAKPKPIVHYMREGLAELQAVVSGISKPKARIKAAR